MPGNIDLQAGMPPQTLKSKSGRVSSQLFIRACWGSTFWLIVGFLAYSKVDNELTSADLTAIPSYLSAVAPLPTDPTFEEQIRFIGDVEKSVLNIVSGNIEVPKGSSREPKDLLISRSGLCFDRSRVIEKVLRYAGFTTRHVALYSTNTTGSAWKSLLTPGTASHAVTEVKTKKGWLVVGSNHVWLSLDVNNMPMSMDMIQEDSKRLIGKINWGSNSPNPIYREPFTYIYGLYSRHGKFFAPYNAIPDVEYGELFQNLF